MANKRVLSVELGVQTSRICELEIVGKKQTVLNSCTFDTPEGAIEDGYIRNKDILGISMKAALQKFGMMSKSVVFTISSSKIANREVNMPKMPETKIQTFVQTNAREYFPIEVEKYVITYKKLEDLKEGDAAKFRILVLAAPNDLIETYYELASVLGLSIIAIDYSGNSSYQILKKQNVKGVNVYVQLNENSTLINIMKNNVLTLQRTVPYGVSAIVDAAINCGEFDIIDKSTAYEKLFSDTLVNPRLNESAIDDVALSYMDSNNDAYSQQIRQMKAKDEITDALSYLVNNTIRVLDYYASKFPDKKVDNIYIIGLGSKIKGIVPLFKNEVYSEIQKLDNIVGVDFSRTSRLGNEDKSEYISVLGAMLDPVDFVPKQHAEQAKQQQQSHYFKLGVGAALIITVALIAWPSGQYAYRQSQIRKLDNEISSYRDVETLLNENNRLSLENTNAKTLYSKTIGYTYLLNVLFDEIQETMPKKSKFITFAYDESGITFNAEAKTLEDVGQFIINIRKCNLISDVQIKSIAGVTEEGSEGFYEFSGNLIPTELDYSKFATKKNVPTEDTVKEVLEITDEPQEENVEGEDAEAVEGEENVSPDDNQGNEAEESNVDESESQN